MEESTNVSPHTNDSGVSDHRRYVIVGLLVFCIAILEVGLIQPFLFEFEKPKELSHSMSICAWFEFYHVCACRLGIIYGYERMTSIGLLLTGVWAFSVTFSGKYPLAANLSYLIATIGPSLALPNAKFSIERYFPQSTGMAHATVVFLTGLGLAIGLNHFKHVQWLWPTYGVVCIVACYLLVLIVPNKAKMEDPLHWLVKAVGVSCLGGMHVFWKYFTMCGFGWTVYWGVFALVGACNFGCVFLMYQ